MFSHKIAHLLDEQKCYQHLIELLQGDSLCCPACKSEHKRVHSYGRAPVLLYQCKGCGKFFNVFTHTVFQGTHYACSVVVLLLRGIAQEISTLS